MNALSLWIDAHPILAGCLDITFSVLIVFAVNAFINYRQERNSRENV